MTVLLLILGFVLFLGLVVIHEYGHFFAARKTGVEVEEFGIGFPPRVWGKEFKSGLLFTINLLPLGGFVKLKGENDQDKSKGSFGAARLRYKVIIMLAGVVMNLLTAIVLFTITAWAGMPQLIDNQFEIASDSKVVRQDVLVAYIEPDSPAAQAGLQLRDRIVAIGKDSNKKLVSTPEDLPDITREHAGQQVNIDIKRKGVEQTLSATLLSSEEVTATQDTENSKGYLGIIPTEYVLKRSTWSAPIVGVGLAGQFTYENVKGISKAIGSVFTGNGSEASEQVSGPIGVVRIIFDSSLLGVQAMLLIIGVISLTLALMNALPIPALDGGRLFVTLLFRVINKPLKKETEDLIHGTGFIALIGLVLLISVIDVKRFF